MDHPFSGLDTIHEKYKHRNDRHKMSALMCSAIKAKIAEVAVLDVVDLFVMDRTNYDSYESSRGVTKPRKFFEFEIEIPGMRFFLRHGATSSLSYFEGWSRKNPSVRTKIKSDQDIICFMDTVSDLMKRKDRLQIEKEASDKKLKDFVQDFRQQCEAKGFQGDGFPHSVEFALMAGDHRVDLKFKMVDDSPMAKIVFRNLSTDEVQSMLDAWKARRES